MLSSFVHVLQFLQIPIYSSRICCILCSRCFLTMSGAPWFACALAKAAVRIGELSVRMVVPMDMKKLRHGQQRRQNCPSHMQTYPKVAAEPTMYWPSVRIMPLGPGPKRMMLVAPKMKPMTRPTAVSRVREHIPQLSTPSSDTYCRPSCRPSSLRNVSLGTCLHGLRRSAHTLVECGLATSTTCTSCDGRHIGRVME